MYSKPVKVLVKKYKVDGAYIIEYENGKKEIISEEELFRNFETRWEQFYNKGEKYYDLARSTRKKKETRKTI